MLIQKCQPLLPHVPASVLSNLVSVVLDRAYAVATAIQLPSNSAQRKKLGYIALSGEDDQPYRPVNIPSTSYPQYDISVAVPVPKTNSSKVSSIVVKTRYFICETVPSTNSSVIPGSNRTLPKLLPPSISKDAEIIVYIHGMDSRAEEAEQLCQQMIGLGKKNGKNYVMISVDLPSQGYATKVCTPFI